MSTLLASMTSLAAAQAGGSIDYLAIVLGSGLVVMSVLLLLIAASACSSTGRTSRSTR